MDTKVPMDTKEFRQIGFAPFMPFVLRAVDSCGHARELWGSSEPDQVIALSAVVKMKSA